MRQTLAFRRALAARERFTIRPLLAALALSLAAAPAIALPVLKVAPPAKTVTGPALWVVSDHDTTIYLFGTFHALDHRRDWFGPRIRAAFGLSQELVLETVVPSDPGELFDLLAKHRLANPPVAGQPVVATKPVASYAASAGEAMATGRTLGMSVEKGADAVLRSVAESEGKPVAGLESFDAQLGMFANLPAVTAKPGIAAIPAGTTRDALVTMRDAWKRGDSERFAAVLGTVEAHSPETYRTLFADRNDQWARWIAERLERPGTVFVAVGAGHLSGKDSVQVKLARRGIRSTRIS